MGFRLVQPTLHHRMMVSGASPIYTGIYQFIIVAMILATLRSLPVNVRPPKVPNRH
jgi:hypothetical protein